MVINTFLSRLLASALFFITSIFCAFSQPPGPLATRNVQTDPHTILPQYVSESDSAYQWEIIQRSTTNKGTFFQLSLVSQRWRNIRWKHNLFVFFPVSYSSTTGFLSLQMSFEPDQAYTGLLQAAQATGMPCAILGDVPNQPLFDGKWEDELLNYTFERYLQTGEGTWPLLLPMVKGAVRAIDALQALTKQQAFPILEHFILAGHSKRGHTAWLTAAVDKRVTGLVIQGFNTLNSVAQIPHYLAVYGELNQSALAAKKVIEQINTNQGQNLLQIVDAYTYRDQLMLPKLLIVGTNDDYTPVDALNLYWSGLRGSKSVLSLTNTDHVGANNDARLFPTAYAFIQATAKGETLPNLQSNLEQQKGKIKLIITTDESASTARVWRTHSSTQDFRESQWVAQSVVLTVDSIAQKKKPFKWFVLEIDEPASGYMALIGEVEFANQSKNFILSTIPYVIKSR
ncbi:Autocrine proliferation repressor PhoPQ-activated pathogenicity-related protein [Fibrella aestuarina BUZ 2]|uniref:Autocrine proliferation repressor PhoPQ-activated pathogenicity-related protein n=1 Tax=Fibrella aestuarina BUZ 2 TaxID=1166018 RepID=I0K7S5_9BACT|nr:Autocrine proliferation repressor PhoPQ-activated pathogenicity-related protein [Fibrella aestuarina]CCH00178.1 Autocrine proliferation repressor PhoPQ-activated pathogenicity-related protein [Fibrella aestuarina BUZ 2]